MSPMRSRAKDQFPMVLLTLLSIVQALALELLWSHLRDNGFLFDPSWTVAISWIQIAATFMGIVLIWVVYASIMMRFRWVPATTDSIYPFLIGLFEFMLIESLGPDENGLWLMFMASIFGIMVWVSHATMRRARNDGDNDAFFSNFRPAKLHDFVAQITIVLALGLAGVYVHMSGDSGLVTLIAVLACNGVIGWQFYQAATFWERSLTLTANK